MRIALACCACGHEWVRKAYNFKQPSGCPKCQKKRVGEAKRDYDILQRLQAIATGKGGLCLSTEYAGFLGSYRFRCALGHEWSTRAGRILGEGTWCRACFAIDRGKRSRRQDGLARLQEHARSKGGACLSAEYTGGRGTYLFRCGKGHEWTVAGRTISKLFWCQQCKFDATRLCKADEDFHSDFCWRARRQRPRSSSVVYARV